MFMNKDNSYNRFCFKRIIPPVLLANSSPKPFPSVSLSLIFFSVFLRLSCQNDKKVKKKYCKSFTKALEKCYKSACFPLSSDSLASFFFFIASASSAACQQEIVLPHMLSQEVHFSLNIPIGLTLHLSHQAVHHSSANQ
jgi:hypothetical protein